MRLWALTRANGANVDDYVLEANGFLTDLDTCQFPNTRAAASSLENLSIPCVGGARIIAPQTANELGMAIRTLCKSLDSESAQRKTIGLDTTGVSARLRALSALPLMDAQAALLDETIRCIECSTYRSAIVMGWSLIYDYIRHWLFTNRLVDFNNYLTTNYLYRSGKPQFDAIVRYEDFFRKDAPGERVVLQSMNGPQIIGGEVYDHLCQYLRYRNNYAHPTFKSPSRDQANSYIEHLITIINEPPFK